MVRGGREEWEAREGEGWREEDGQREGGGGREGRAPPVARSWGDALRPTVEPLRSYMTWILRGVSTTERITTKWSLRRR